MSRAEIGLIGGTFNPIHIGHLVIAERAMEQLGLDGVIFLPAGVPPHKLGKDHAPAPLRLAMTHRAVADRSAFSVSDRDIRPDRASYTVDLLRDVKADNPDANLTFIIGGDSLRDFPTWHEPDGIVRIARLAVANRPDVEIPDDIYDQVRGLREAVSHIEAPLLDISSTDLRARVAAGKSIRYLVPEGVIQLIEEAGLYQNEPGASDVVN
jgi:nicotinate-nucleotide adenylyltransferase